MKNAKKIVGSKKKNGKQPRVRTQTEVMATCLEEIGQAAKNAATELLLVRNRLDNWHFDLLDVRNSIPSPGAVDLQFADACRTLWLAVKAIDRIQVCVDYATPPKAEGGAS